MVAAAGGRSRGDCTLHQSAPTVHMDSEQDIAAELERLNTELHEIAAAEDITLSVGKDIIVTGRSADTGSFYSNDASHLAAPAKQLDSSNGESKTPQVLFKEQVNSILQQESPSKAASTVATKSHQHSLHSPHKQLQSNPQAPPVDVSVASSADLPPANAAHTLLFEPPQHPHSSLQQGLLLQELLHQHGKLLDLLRIFANNSSANKDKQQDKHQQQLADTDADAEEDINSDLAPDARYIALQEQYQNQLLDNHRLKKRLNKVQKVVLQHLQDAQLRAAASEAACDEAQRREQDARAAAAALQVQLVLQQQDLQQQQLAFAAVRDQLQQVKDLHKQKIAEARVELKQQYDAQLQATTAAYAQELAQIQAHLAGSKQRHFSKRARSSSAAAAARPDQQATVKGSRSARKLATAPVAARQPGQPGCTAARCSRSGTPTLAAADGHQVAASAVPAITSVPVTPSTASHSAFARHQQQQQGQGSNSEELHVPADVVQYAQQYQQGGEGSSRPPTAPPSVLQRRRQQEQPVPEAAAQLAQHFVTGGEGISRPLTAPSSDRLISRHSGNSTARTSHSHRPSVRTIVEPLVPLLGVARYLEDLKGFCDAVGVERV